LAKLTSSLPATTVNGSQTIESVLAVLHSLWKDVESADEVDQIKLRREITQTINRLKSRVEKHLRSFPQAKRERLLFDGLEDEKIATVSARVQPHPRFPEATQRIYDKDLVDHALSHIPSAIKFKTVSEFREYLTAKIRSNSLATRRRTANYLINRFFPGEVLHSDLAVFASAREGKQALSDALFYLTCRMEPIVASVAEEVVFLALPEGGVARGRILEYVQSKFPGSKSVSEMSQAIVRTYERFGIGTATRTRLSVSLRKGGVAAFGYILHLEFPEPGMFSFERLLGGPLHKWLLWDQQWMVRQLYLLREAEILSKVSEIDRICQFTTKYCLDDAVPHIVALAEETNP
jgi:hypothetical protein